MKKPYISKKLDSYIEAVKPPREQVLMPAYIELQNINRAPVRKTTREHPALRRFAFMAAVIAVICIMVYTLMPSPSSQDPPKIELNYSMSSLSMCGISKNSIQNLSDSEIITLNLTEKDEKHILYVFGENSKYSGEPAVLASVYKVINQNSVDEIIVITDIKGGLNDYRQFKSFNLLSQYDTDIRARLDKYLNGEFYSYIQLNKDGIDYYIMIMSPKPSRAAEYISLLIGD